MFKWFKPFQLLLLLMMSVLLLSACGSISSSATKDSQASSQIAASQKNKAASDANTQASATRQYTDKTGRNVEVPAAPQRIVYIGSSPGDLLAIGVQPLGASLSVIASQVAYPDLLTGIEDVGYPYSLEKIAALNPDLILFDDWSMDQFEMLEKIAPTVIIGNDHPVDMMDRLHAIGTVLNQTSAVDKWMATYKQKVQTTRASLKLSDNATVSSLLLFGNTMYIMGNQGLNQTLYEQLNLKPNANVKKLINKNERFISVSNELVSDYVGTDLFLLTSTDSETIATQSTLLSSPVWKMIPAVKQGKVYVLDSKWNFDDPITSERLLDELVRIVNKTNG
ncbi:ABC transporter substrate-binding protein [Paenibacillus wenxiniae]|uniref:ABC transporter substrate-binding protein n=1 Tax=Paenibacillus wenxiniae TaxID=1636843 RepID=A0ABW4RPB5_9BACL